MQQVRNSVELQHPFTVTVHGDVPKQTLKLPNTGDMFPGIYLDPNSQWLCYNVYYRGELIGPWYQLGPEVWLRASYDSLD
ncbi:hypothetical protein FC83_GL002948 [Agrilactobacillus composti DSM 18527 = JCM 14202]|uniref:Uncharacterized protein n=1 Tax=Agrilactobacillus composti DSM 18527 = JCM 14202 TaxID=1423734 RepID=A0A0R1Y247_9LACO|nr:hypothetical protein FC83_GL002948 [Agrilactobacillus composti DSM 18527 = JCM 14202]